MPRINKYVSLQVPLVPVDELLPLISESIQSRYKRRKTNTSSALRIPVQIVKIIVMLHLVFMFSTTMCLIVYKYINPGSTTLMLYRKYTYKWKLQVPSYVSLSKIPRTIQTMAIKVEDGDFYNHHGIIPAAIKNAWQLNKRFGEPVYGGSTITMQTARTLFLVPEKSYFRKYLEAIIAIEMEIILGKQRILELYFNYAEWGKGIFGIETASRYYYKTGIRSLNTDQSIRLITLLSSPIRYGPFTFQSNRILQSRYNYLIQRFGK